MDLTTSVHVSFGGYGGFVGTGRYITPRMHAGMKNILTAMNAEAKYVDNGNSFEMSTVTGLKLHCGKDDATLTDRRFLMKKVPEEEQMERGVTEMNLGKTHLVIDNNSGEILSYEKPIFKTWSKIMEQLHDAFYTFESFYTKDKIVEKVKFTIHGLTEKGLKQFNETHFAHSAPQK